MSPRTRKLIEQLVKEDLFNFTGKNSERPVSHGDERVWKAFVADMNMLEKSVARAKEAAMDDDEALAAKMLDRIKQFTKRAEGAILRTEGTSRRRDR